MALEKRDEDLIPGEKERETEREEKGMNRVEDIPGNFYGKCLGSHKPG